MVCILLHILLQNERTKQKKNCKSSQFGIATEILVNKLVVTLKLGYRLSRTYFHLRFSYQHFGINYICQILPLLDHIIDICLNKTVNSKRFYHIPKHRSNCANGTSQVPNIISENDCSFNQCSGQNVYCAPFSMIGSSNFLISFVVDIMWYDKAF